MAGENYLGTTSVTVFPSARRASTQVTARMLSEKSMVSIVNRLIDKEGFIITKQEDILLNDGTLDLSKPIEFNIYGYYFKVGTISSITTLAGASNTMYAAIILTTNDNFEELYGQDDNSYYKGLIITANGNPESIDTTGIVNPKVKMLKLLTKNEVTNKWNIATDSMFKFVTGSLDFDIDGGEIGTPVIY